MRERKDWSVYDYLWITEVVRLCWEDRHTAAVVLLAVGVADDGWRNE